MHADFKKYAAEDADGGYRYGVECLFRFYSYGLEANFKPDLYKEFEEQTLKVGFPKQIDTLGLVSEGDRSPLARPSDSASSKQQVLRDLNKREV